MRIAVLFDGMLFLFDTLIIADVFALLVGGKVVRA